MRIFHLATAADWAAAHASGTYTTSTRVRLALDPAPADPTPALIMKTPIAALDGTSEICRDLGRGAPCGDKQKMCISVRNRSGTGSQREHDVRCVAATDASILDGCSREPLGSTPQTRGGRNK